MATSFQERRAALAALGPYLTPEMVAGTIAIAAPDIDSGIGAGVTVTENVAYGPHERQVLDVYTPTGGGATRPVLVYVHGGGFVRGAKSAPGSPYFANLGGWAVQHGFVAVVMNYRLAPEFTYPSGAQDIAAAITWTVEHIAALGGNPAHIFLAGQSAGAVHVADYVVGHGGYGPHGRSLAGAILVSCLFEAGRASVNGLNDAYWGADTSRWGEFATAQGLVETDLPLLLTVSELDEPEFLDHAASFVGRWFAAHRTYPPLHLLYGQNHLTPVYGIGSRWDDLGPKIEQFVEVNTR